MPRGIFVTFDGLDGSGKGTQIIKAVDYVFSLSKENDIYLTREPTRDFSEIRKRMAAGTDVKKDARWYLDNFVSDRINHCLNYISPNLERRTHVFSDRYKYATITYQSLQGIPVEEIIFAHKNPAILVPDLTLIYDCPAEIAFERRKKGGATDVFDKDLEFQKSLREKYLQLPSLLPKEKIIIIDASRSIEEVFEETKIYLNRLFKK
ncbi:dTMP kinase [Candidatus Pacearchaeota archaeon]|nr:dTMP kinase [Candidatus Pacearchaeota archaeon]